jgi:uncharacterized protein (DUF433 family)
MARERKSAPFSMRLSEDTDRLITALAKRTKRSKGAVVEALATEALKAQLVPGIAFRDEDYNRRAWVIGTGLDVWQIVEAYRDFDEDRERMLAETDLSEGQLRTALAYSRRFPEEVEEFIALNRRPVDELLRDYPHAEAIYVDVD